MHLKILSAKWWLIYLSLSVLSNGLFQTSDDPIHYHIQLIEAEWHIYASVDCAIIHSGNGLLS